jgi:hypothetical protein
MCSIYILQCSLSLYLLICNMVTKLTTKTSNSIKSGHILFLLYFLVGIGECPISIRLPFLKVIGRILCNSLHTKSIISSQFISKVNSKIKPFIGVVFRKSVDMRPPWAGSQIDSPASGGDYLLHVLFQDGKQLS